MAVTLDLKTLNLQAGHHSVKATALATGYQESDYSNVIEFDVYSVTVNCRNCTYSAPSLVYPGDSVTIQITPNDGCILPTYIQVNTGQYTYDSTTGEITVYGAEQNLVVTVNCIAGYVKFYSDNSFTLSVIDTIKYWDGTLYYSTDNSTYTEWDGTTTISAAATNNVYQLYLRGTGNTYLTGSTASSTVARWSLSGTSIYSEGNLDALLDHETVLSRGTPTRAAYTFSYLLSLNEELKSSPELPSMVVYLYGYNCLFYHTGIVHAPELPAMTLSESCYRSMFSECSSLIEAPKLPAKITAAYCYYYMFKQCTSLTEAPELPAIYTYSYCYAGMFRDCSNLTKAPSILPAKNINTYSYYAMFYGCSKLTEGPVIMGTTCAQYGMGIMFFQCKKLVTIYPILVTTLSSTYCFYQMFDQCTSLEQIPRLYPTTYTNYACQQMFYGCSKIKMSQTQDSTYTNAWRIPYDGTGSVGTNSLSSMFSSTGGSFKTTAVINTTYYTSNEVVYEHTLTTNITNGEWVGIPIIVHGRTMTGKIRPEGGVLPQTITVSGCDYTYDNTTGTVTLITPTGDVSITANCTEITSSIVFISEKSFSLRTFNRTKNWNGTMQYSTNNSTWDTWGGTELLYAKQNADGYYRLFIRGIENTYINSSNDSPKRWRLDGESIYCYGNLENILDYETVSLGNHPSLTSNYNFAYIFAYNPELLSAPKVSGISLSGRQGVLWCLFRGCYKLETITKLTTDTYGDYACGYMFYQCYNIRVNTSVSGQYNQRWRIPYDSSVTGTAGTGSFSSFYNSSNGQSAANGVLNADRYIPEFLKIV